LYQTIEISRDRRSVLLGKFESDHIYVLRSSTLMPVRELAAVTHASPVYNEGNRRSVFYAESWALAHYLMFGSDERRTQFGRYLAAVNQGAAPDVAFADIFGDAKILDGELSLYVKRAALPLFRVELTQQLALNKAGRGQPIHESEVEGYLGELLAGMGRRDEARAHFERALARKDDAVVPAIGRANLAAREGKSDEALGLFEAVAGRAPDHFDAQLGFGRALFVAYSEHSGTATALLTRARAPLTRAVSLDPSSAEAAAMLGFVELQTDDDLARAVELLRKAIDLAPAREDFRLYLANALIRQRDYTRATQYLGPLMGSGSTQEIRDAARGLMAYMANVKSAAANNAAGASVDGLPAALPIAPPDPSASGEPGGGRSRAPRIILDLRPVGPGEERIIGMFTGVECQATGIAVLVQAPTTFRLRASKFDQVAFISYRSDKPTTIQCGMFPAAQRVLATFRREADGTLDAVAIELLPDDYTPPN
jgi:tetratricopeptide (TPR) repeat protein